MFCSRRRRGCQDTGFASPAAVLTSSASPAMERSRGNKVPLCIKNANGTIVKKLLTEALISANIFYRKKVLP